MYVHLYSESSIQMKVYITIYQKKKKSINGKSALYLYTFQKKLRVSNDDFYLCFRKETVLDWEHLNKRV